MTTSFDRRWFLARGGYLTGGAAIGFLASRWRDFLPTPAAAQEAGPEGAEERLRKLKLELPAVTAMKATLVRAVRVGEMLYVSGTVPTKPDGKLLVGKVGKDLNVKEARAAARLVGLKILSVIRRELGSLDKVVRLVKALGMVNATPEFKDHPQVINGFSDLMVEVFGERAGKGARSAVGMASLPGGIPVEIEAIFQVRG